MERWRSLGVLVLVVTAIYLYAYPTATLFYAGAVLLHTGLGVLVSLALAVFLFRGIRKERLLARFGWILLAAGAALGLALIRLGTPHRLKAWLYAHIALCTLGVIFLAASWLLTRGWLGASFARQLVGFAALLLVTTGIAAGTWYAREFAWQNRYVVNNPAISPATMLQEGDGAHGKFFPSSAQTTDGQYIPSGYFLKSQACERCHADIYKQW